jgi:thymidine phosphorylase
MLVQDLIAAKRDGRALTAEQIGAWVDGLAGRPGALPLSDAQAAAMAMAIVCRGMLPQETAALTRAMTDSGEVLRWRGAQRSPGLQAPDGVPLLDKHSTGGVGDKVSLLLAPLLAACGAWVPMISGRGLAHTGGTLDKLEALPGYRVDVEPAALQRVLQASGCAIVGASARLAPADRRLYAIRDVTATVESLPLITASILSKKLAAGLDALVMDVKLGRGAFMGDLEGARALAVSLVEVARRNGLPTVALITDMDVPLGRTAGNALEVAESLQALTDPSGADARLRDVTVALAVDALVLGGLAADRPSAEHRVHEAWRSGRAAERFAAMVRALGGPADVLRAPDLPAAPVCRPLSAGDDGWVAGFDTRGLGWAVVELGGGRRVPGEAVDPRVGLSGLPVVGQAVRRGEPLLWVHAADEASAERALQRLAAAVQLQPAAPPPPPPVVRERLAVGAAGSAS